MLSTHLIRRTKPVIVGVAIVLAAVLPSGCSSDGPGTFLNVEEAARGNLSAQPFRPADFTLTDQHGQPFTLSDQHGKVVLLFFGYTECKDMCPFTLGIWSRVERELQDLSKGVRFVFVTLDPTRDTPEVIGRHLGHYSSDFVGLTGAANELEPVYRDFEVVYDEVESRAMPLKYLMSHTFFIHLLDQEGIARATYTLHDGPDVLVHDIKGLLERNA